MLSQSSLPEAISTQLSQMEKQGFCLIQQPSFQPASAFAQQLASFFPVWVLVTTPQNKIRRNDLKASWFKKKKNEVIWCWVGCANSNEKSALVLSGCAAFYLGNEGKKIFPWSATPCDIPAHTLLLTFYLPLNSPAVVTFSGFLNCVLQDLKSEGRDFKKITSVDRHLYISRSCHTLMMLEVGEHSLLTSSKICPEDRRG